LILRQGRHQNLCTHFGGVTGDGPKNDALQQHRIKKPAPVEGKVDEEIQEIDHFQERKKKGMPGLSQERERSFGRATH